MRQVRLTVVLVGALAVLGAPAFPGEPTPAGLSEESIRNAKTSQQHQAIADAYASEARDLRAKAAMHRRMDSWYGEPGYLSRKLGFKTHCQALAEKLESVAVEADALAAAHGKMAEDAARSSK